MIVHKSNLCKFYFQVEKSLENQSTGASRDGPGSIEIQEVTEDCIHYLSTLDHDDNRHDPGIFYAS